MKSPAILVSMLVAAQAGFTSAQTNTAEQRGFVRIAAA